MPKGEAFGIATSQSHALGKSPKGYGTEQGRETASAKYQTPDDDRKTANPGNLSSPKMASFTPPYFNAFVDELVTLTEKTGGVMGNVAGALRNPSVAGHATELAGLGVLAVPGLDTMQAGIRSRMAGDHTPEGAEKRRVLGEGAHAAADVGGLGILMGPEIGHLRHLVKAGASEPKTDQELREVGRQRGVTNLAAEATREKGRRGERFGEAFGRIAGGLGGGALGRRLIGGPVGTVAGMAGGLMAGGRLGKELGTERDIHKNAGFAGYSQYGGNQAPNPPGMRPHSPLAPYREPPLAVKQAGVGVGSGMSASQYSGPLSYGAFKMTSGIPAFRSPEMTRQDGSNQPAGWMVGGGKTAASLAALNASTTPAGRLAAGQRVGAPRTTAPAGPSIAEIAKPKGFGMPLAGATKPLS
jgi:hypothetical protein